MGGYVAALGAWERFEPAARSVLDHANVPILHAKEFHDTDPPFDGWSRSQKLTFATNLYDIVKEHLTLGLAFSARKGRYKQRSFQLGLNKNTSAYGFCFTVILNRILLDPILKPQIAANGLSFIIESGNKNNGDIERTFHAIKRIHNLEPILRTLTFADKQTYVALQLADFVAFHMRRHAEKCEAAGAIAVPPEPVVDLIAKSIRHLGAVATDFGGDEDPPPLKEGDGEG